ncbi:hypothetical protein ACTWQB_13430 [Piscibacillus sp. B03]|uniref:hypothetical protein n=1 Tax=Piscibacillus sp. B03 TaxID=3457430 RepID=UPI003FCD2C97
MSYYDEDEVVSLGTWVILLIVLAIPIINFIVYLVLALGDHNENLKNFAKASLLLMLIAIFFSGCAAML